MSEKVDEGGHLWWVGASLKDKGEFRGVAVTVADKGSGVLGMVVRVKGLFLRPLTDAHGRGRQVPRAKGLRTPVPAKGPPPRPAEGEMRVSVYA